MADHSYKLNKSQRNGSSSALDNKGPASADVIRPAGKTKGSSSADALPPPLTAKVVCAMGTDGARPMEKRSKDEFPPSRQTGGMSEPSTSRTRSETARRGRRRASSQQAGLDRAVTALEDGPKRHTPPSVSPADPDIIEVLTEIQPEKRRRDEQPSTVTPLGASPTLGKLRQKRVFSGSDGGDDEDTTTDQDRRLTASSGRRKRDGMSSQTMSDVHS